MKKTILGVLTILALFLGGYMIASSSNNCAQVCTGGPDCPCNPCPFKK